MRLRGLILAVLGMAMVGAAVPARAQWAVYAQGTGAELAMPNTGHLYGGTGGFYKTQRAGIFAIGPDFRASILQRGNVAGSFTDERMDLGMVGVRFAVTPHVLPVMPYAEGMVGIGYWRGGQGLTRQDKMGGTIQALVGADYTILPRIDWRIAEFTYGRMTGIGETINPRTLSTGIVFRLP